MVSIAGLALLFERFPELRRAGTGRRRPTRILRGWAELPMALSYTASVSSWLRRFGQSRS